MKTNEQRLAGRNAVVTGASKGSESVEDIAPAAAFLASNEAAWITGETFIIAGGLR